MNAEDRIDMKLDYALEMTFPASDPFTVYMPEVHHDDEGTLAAQSPEIQIAA